MANFNDIKESLLAKLGKAADTTKDLAAKAADKAKSGARIAKLTMEIAGEKDNMKKSYIEIGKLYYENSKDAPEGVFVQLFEEVALAQKNIAEKEAEIEELKAADSADDGTIEVEFEEIVSEEEAAAEAPVEEVPAEEAPAEEEAE